MFSERTESRLWRWLGYAGSVASLAGLAVTCALNPEFLQWFFPLPALVVLCACLATALAITVHRRRSQSADQARLDRLFNAVPREAVTSIRRQDFSALWPDELIDPVASFYRDFGDVEHRFDARGLEKRRERLYQAAGVLLEEEAGAFDFDRGAPRRFLGVTPATLESASSAERERFERRRSKLHAAALDFVKAHDALVEEAKQRRFDLGGLEANREKRSWSGFEEARPQVIRARWPGE